MNYYQSLNTDSKIFFIAYQICRLEKISKIYDNIIQSMEESGTNTDDIFKAENKLYKMINQKKLKLKLLRKVKIT
jgi:hypothetical protein